MNIETVNKSNLKDYIGLDIVAFHWAEGGACGEPAAVLFVTWDGRVCYTNYAYLVSESDLFKIFHPFATFNPGTFGGGEYPAEWKDQYLGLGNFLVVHESLWDAFSKKAEEELALREQQGQHVILYKIWVDVLLDVLNNTID